MRILSDRRRNPSLPSISGITGDLETAAWGAGGLALTAAVSDKYISPTARKFVPNAGEMVGKAVDAGCALLSANLVGWLISRFNPGGGRLARLGGTFYAGGKLLSIPIKSFAITAQLPTTFGQLAPAFPAGSKMPAAGAAGAPAALSSGTMAALPSNVPGETFASYARPVDASQNVGL